MPASTDRLASQTFTLAIGGSDGARHQEMWVFYKLETPTESYTGYQQQYEQIASVQKTRSKGQDIKSGSNALKLHQSFQFVENKPPMAGSVGASHG